MEYFIGQKVRHKEGRDVVLILEVWTQNVLLSENETSKEPSAFCSFEKLERDYEIVE